MPAKFWRWGIPCALAIHCLLAALAIRQRPGLNNDEALFVLGSVQMRISPDELSLPHDPDTWVRVFGQHIQIMTVRYVGAVKDYLCLPLFAIFRHHTSVIRVVSMLLALVGIWGLAKLIRDHASPPAAALTAAIIAINPAYLYSTTFDSSAAATYAATIGLLCLAISHYLRVRTAAAAFWIGAAMGFGIWARSNFLWLLGALIFAAVIVLGKRLLLPGSHWVRWALGGVVGGFPFLFYQVLSKGGSWQALGMFYSPGTFQERVSTRLVMFAETLLADRERRAMWDGPFMPGWQRWLFPSIALVCVVAALITRTDRNRLTRVLALVFLFYGGMLLLSRSPVSEHHLIALMPFAAAVAALVCWNLANRSRTVMLIAAALAIVYIGSAMYWQSATIQGLRRTGGVGQWSDGINPLALYLEEKHSVKDIKILDWGFQTSLFVLTDGKVHTQEIFGDATAEQSGLHRPWLEEIRDGGIFVLNGPNNRMLPLASVAFLKTLAQARPALQRRIFQQRNHVPFAEVMEIESDSIGKGTPSADEIPSSLSTGDDGAAKQLDGFYGIENGWRWTQRQFSITLGSPPANSRLTVQLYIPDSIVQKLGAITLTAKLGDHTLAPETYRQPGQHTFTRDVEASWIHPGANRIDFSLDKFLAPTPGDKRELGIVVLSAALEPN
ncbi:MAG TPA: glycosyltransferase family 39 protein [Bryobacteraceae bacterium]